MTEKLYYQDSHLKEFTARVISCRWDEKRNSYGVVLERTVFFPEGGGQYADAGVLAGIPVEDVQEKEDVITHYVKEPLEEGIEVSGSIDYRERFSKMQQHTGEHIVSGLVHSHFGYDNVGFHLGREQVTMDFNGGLTKEQLRMLEQEANEAVVANIPVQVTYPSKEELDKLEYRSKKELKGQVRIVTVPGYDVCACCAPHVVLTGEIGLIRLVDGIKYKGGTRVTMVCGFRALEDCHIKEDNIEEISHLLSAKLYESAEAVKRLWKEHQQTKDKLFRMESRYLDRRTEELVSLHPAAGPDTDSKELDSFLLFEEEMDKNAARRFVDAGMHRFKGICGIFIGNDRNGYQYILGSQQVNLRELLKEFHQSLPGKGGGKTEMVQGTVSGSRTLLESFFEAFLRD